MVLPMKGTQWKTRGGSSGVLKSSWRKTLSITARTQKVANAAATMTPVDLLESCCPNGPAIAASSPILKDRFRLRLFLEDEEVTPRGVCQEQDWDLRS